MFENIKDTFALCHALETTFLSTLRCVFTHKRKGLSIALLPKLLGKPIDTINIPLMKINNGDRSFSRYYSITKEDYVYELKTSLYWGDGWHEQLRVSGFKLQTPHGIHRSLLRNLKKYASKHHLDIGINRLSDNCIDITGHVAPPNLIPVFNIDKSLLKKCH